MNIFSQIINLNKFSLCFSLFRVTTVVERERMLGRVRASSISSLELLEMERPSSKIIKHDSLSIYESTLLKLKQGSHCNPWCNSEDSSSVNASCNMAIDLPEEAMTTDADFSSKEQSSKNMSILHFFSKCKSSNHANNSNNKELMVIDSGSSTSTSTSTSSSSSGVSPTCSS